VLYTEHLDERSGEMAGVFIVESTPGRDPLTIIADNGRLISNPQAQALTLQLQNGTIHRKGADKTDRNTYQVIRFSQYDVRPDLGNVTSAPKFALRTNPGDMSTGELWEAANGGDEKALAARGALHNRLSAPLAPLLFALFILPCATQNQRSGRSGAFVTGLIIYLGYFVTTALAEKATATIGMHPFFSFWLLHAAFFAVGFYLLRQSALERPALFLVWIDRVVVFSRTFLRRRDAHA
jgi:lipopolysaccharide export LptBFGC system permease protein LptF